MAGCIRISSMKKGIIISIGFVVVILGSALVYLYFWREGEMARTADVLNRIDYTYISQDDRDDYLKEDLGMTMQELLDRSPSDSNLKYFPELYLAARVLGAEENGVDRSLEYYQKAEGLLANYAKKDKLSAEFYVRYLSLAVSYGKNDLAKGLESRARDAINASSLSDNKKAQLTVEVNAYMVALELGEQNSSSEVFTEERSDGDQ